MPLRCLLDGVALLSFMMGDDEWTRLKGSYSTRTLVMACCGARAIPKVSKLGTRFFAHKPRAGCESAGESAAHLHAKWVIARAAIDAGWQAETEVSGRTPDGADWIADVLCTKGAIKVAFEVQLAGQTLEDYWVRQKRYFASGVRGCWLAKRPPRVEERELPLFHIDVSDMEALVVSTSKVTLPLEEFVEGALTGKLKWLDGSPGKYHYELGLIWADCWQCKERVSLVHGISFRGFTHMIAMLQIAQEHIVDLTELIADVSKLRERFPSVASLEFRVSRTKGSPYLASICPRCKTAFSEWFTFNVTHPRKVTHGIRMGVITVNKAEVRVAGIEFRMPAGWAWLGEVHAPMAPANQLPQQD